jgi:hypothetical protein
VSVELEGGGDPTPGPWAAKHGAFGEIALINRTKSAPLRLTMKAGKLIRRADFETLCAAIVAALNAREA